MPLNSEEAIIKNMPEQKTKIISFFSTKGGTGKTLLALNTAVAIAQEGKKVVLLDFDLGVVGDVARALNLETTQIKSALDLFSLFEKKEVPDLAEITKFINKIPQYNIDFLPAVLRPRQVSLFNPNFVEKIFSLLEKVAYDFIVVDSGTVFSDTQINCFNYSNLLLLVVTPDILSVYQTKWSVDILQNLKFPLDMIKIILNRAESFGGAPYEEVKAQLPCEILGRIPSEGRIVGLALNKYTPVVVYNPKATVSKAIKDLAKVLISRADIYLEPLRLEVKEESLAGIAKTSGFWQMYKLTEFYKSTAEEPVDEIVQLKKRLHNQLLERMDLKRLEIDLADPQKSAEIRERAEKHIVNILASETKTFLSNLEVRRRLITEIINEALGLGPLEDLLADSDISDILVNGKDAIYIEKFGKLELTSKRFISDEQLRHTIERIIAPLGRRIDEFQPMVDARLPDGSRVNAIIPPLSLSGPVLTIRKFGIRRLNIDDLLKINTLDERMRNFLELCVTGRCNIIISGGTGSGKTTVLNVMSAFIPNRERIVTIEDAAELKLMKDHWVRLESRPPNIEGKGAVTIRDLFRNTLRMRPDRIIIGECRGAETLDMLQAMNTGHDGSMTTIHANSTHDVLTRLDSMVLMSGVELPVKAIREMISSAIHIIVHTARLSDGSRKIMQITEVTGMLDEMHIGMQDIFVFKQTGVDKDGKVLGYFTPTGYVPARLVQEFKVKGFSLDEEIFKSSAK